MKAKFGSIVVAGRGKIGGHVASQNRGGAYFRTKVSPLNPQTSYQVGIRNRLAGIASSWRGLTASQRAAWNAAVSAFSKTDVFGDLRNPTGISLHQALNNNLLICSEAVLTSPPVPAQVDAFVSLTPAMAAGAGTATLTFSPAVSANHKVKVFATPGLSAGVSYAKNQYRLIEVLDSADVSPFNVKSAYEARFGSIPSAGLKVFFKLVQVNTDTGQAGIEISNSCVVAA